jgi:transposase-like protein
MNAPASNPNRKFKRYDLNFKRAAVELWLGGGQSAQAVADELGISVQALKTWKQQLAVPPPASGAQTVEALEVENRRLRRELQYALRQREILKKSLGIFATTNEPGLNG